MLLSIRRESRRRSAPLGCLGRCRLSNSGFPDSSDGGALVKILRTFAGGADAASGIRERIPLPMQHRITRQVLFREIRPASADAVGRYFGPPRMPGTAVVGLRRRRPELFQDSIHSPLETYACWRDRTLSTLLAVMIDRRSADSATLFDIGPREIVDAAAAVLDLFTPDGVPLYDAVPQQIYEDAFIRILSLFSAPRKAHPYREFNALCHRIALAALDALHDRGVSRAESPDIPKLIQVAVLSGHVGINLKTSASAASVLLNRDRVPIQTDWVRDMASVRAVSPRQLDTVVDALLRLAEQPEGRFGLDCLAAYFREVADCRRPTLLVFFCDDYLESMIDLKRFEVMLDRNPRLTVLFVPRCGRHGNDLADRDMAAILSAPQFEGGARLLAAGRLFIAPDGPRAGCIDFRDLSDGLIGRIDRLGAGRRVVFETKGCRNFEMLQGGLTVPWYASFNCNRALSIRTAGVDGPPVFLRIPPGLKAYDGFADPVIGPSPSYGTVGVRFARMTTRQLLAALATHRYRDLLHRSGDERSANRIVSRMGADLGMTTAELLAGDEALPAFQRAGRFLS